MPYTPTPVPTWSYRSRRDRMENDMTSLERMKTNIGGLIRQGDAGSLGKAQDILHSENTAQAMQDYTNRIRQLVGQSLFGANTTVGAGTRDTGGGGFLGGLKDVGGSLLDLGGKAGGATLTALNAPYKYVGAPLEGLALGAGGMERKPIRDAQGNIVGYTREGGQGLGAWASNVAGAITSGDVLHPQRMAQQAEEYNASLPWFGQAAARTAFDPLSWVGPGLAKRAVSVVPGARGALAAAGAERAAAGALSGELGVRVAPKLTFGQHLAEGAVNLLDAGGPGVVIGGNFGGMGAAEFGQRRGWSPAAVTAIALAGGLGAGLAGGAAYRGLTDSAARASMLRKGLGALAQEAPATAMLPDEGGVKGRKVVNGKVVGLPLDAQTEGALAALRAKVRAYALQGAPWKHWYESSGDVLRSISGGDVDQGTRAALVFAWGSVDTQVANQGAMASKALAQLAAGVPITKANRYSYINKSLRGMLDLYDSDKQAFADKVAEMVSGEMSGQAAPKGGAKLTTAPKIGNFFVDLLDEVNPDLASQIREKSGVGVTVDRWVARAYGYQRDVPTAQQRLFIQNDIAQQARELGWQPKEVQAAIWVTQLAEARGWTLAEAGGDYADALRRHTAQVAWETMPAEDSAMAQTLAGIEQAGPEIQAQLHYRLGHIGLDAEGNDILASKLGLPSLGQFDGPGIEKLDTGMNVHPGTQSVFPAAQETYHHLITDPLVRTQLDAYAALTALWRDQRAVPWTKPIAAEKSGWMHNGVLLKLDGPIEPQLAARIGAALPEDYVLIPSPEGALIYALPDEADLAARAPRTKGQTERLPLQNKDIGAKNAERIATIQKAIDEAVPDREVRFGTLATDGSYVTREDGEALLNAIGQRGSPAWLTPDLRATVLELQGRSRLAADEFAREYGFGPYAQAELPGGPSILDLEGSSAALTGAAGQEGVGGLVRRAYGGTPLRTAAQTVAGAAYGASQSPEDRLAGAATGALTGFAQGLGARGVSRAARNAAARAAEQGDTANAVTATVPEGTRVFHGTTKDFEGAPGVENAAQGYYGPGLYATKDLKTSDAYAQGQGGTFGVPRPGDPGADDILAGGRVYPLDATKDLKILVAEKAMTGAEVKRLEKAAKKLIPDDPSPLDQLLSAQEGGRPSGFDAVHYLQDYVGNDTTRRIFLEAGFDGVGAPDKPGNFGRSVAFFEPERQFSPGMGPDKVNPPPILPGKTLTEQLPEGTRVFHGTPAEYPGMPTQPTGATLKGSNQPPSISPGYYFFAGDQAGEKAGQWAINRAKQAEGRATFAKNEPVGARVIPAETARDLNVLNLDQPITSSEVRALVDSVELPPATRATLLRIADNIDGGATELGSDFIKDFKAEARKAPNLKAAGFDGAIMSAGGDSYPAKGLVLTDAPTQTRSIWEVGKQKLVDWLGEESAMTALEQDQPSVGDMMGAAGRAARDGDQLPKIIERVFALPRFKTGLTRQDVLLNALKKTLGFGTQEDPIATPVMRARRALKPVIDSQASRLGMISGQLAKVFERDKWGRIITLEGAPTIQDLAAKLPVWWQQLNPDQQAAMTRLRDETKLYKDILDAADINLTSRPDVIEGGFYLPRGRADLEGLDMPDRVPSNAHYNVNAKKGFEKEAKFDTMAEGLDNGFEYAPFDQAMQAYGRHAGNRALDQYTADYFKHFTLEDGTPLAQSPTYMAIAANPELADKLAGLKKQLTSLRGQLKTLTLHQQNAIDEFLANPAPDIDALRDAIGDMSPRAGRNAGKTSKLMTMEIRATEAMIKDLAPKWRTAVRYANRNWREQGSISALAPGSQYPLEVANAANKWLNAERPTVGAGADTLNAVNGFNNLMRGLRATADVSFMGIQGLLGAVHDPKGYGKALEVAWQSIADPNALGKYILDFDQRMSQAGRLTSGQWAQYGLHLNGPDTEFAIQSKGLVRALKEVPNLPVAKQSNRMFGYFGDSLRMELADTMLERAMASGMKLDEAGLRQIANTADLMTGWSPQRFAGSVGNLINFAPRFFESQLELTAAAFKDGTLAGQNARRAFLKLLGAGTLLTIGANLAAGNKLDLDPESSNFMRIRFGGQDISLFGPWDSLLKVMMSLSPVSPTEGVRALKGEVSPTDIVKKPDPLYVLRTKASPLLGMAWDVMSGKDFTGQDTHNLEYFARSLLPFSVNQLDRSTFTPAGAGRLALGMTGAKASPLTPSENLNVYTQQRYGADFWKLEPSQRQAVMTEKPDLWQRYVENSNEKRKRAEVVKTDIEAQQQARDDQLLAGKLTVAQWQSKLDDARKELSFRKKEIYGDNPITDVATPLDAYYQAMDAATDKNTDITDWDQVDAWLAQQTAADQAYIDRNSGLGGTPLAQLYRKVQKEYFDLPRYRGVPAAKTSQMEDAIAAARALLNLRPGQTADRARLLQKLSQAQHQYGLDPVAVTYARRYLLGLIKESPERERYKRMHPEVAILNGSGPLSARQLLALQNALQRPPAAAA